MNFLLLSWSVCLCQEIIALVIPAKAGTATPKARLAEALVIPAKAGTGSPAYHASRDAIPAFAGMTSAGQTSNQ